MHAELIYVFAELIDASAELIDVFAESARQARSKYTSLSHLHLLSSPTTHSNL